MNSSSASSSDRPPELIVNWFCSGSLMVGLACIVLVVTGTFATAAGPHSGSIAVPRVWSFKPAVWLHVRATAVFGISFALLLAWVALHHVRQLRAAILVICVLAAQMAVGEIQYRTKLPWWLVLMHVVAGTAVWAGMVTLAALFRRPIAAVAPRRG